MDAAALRAQYPVFESVAYLNAGTCGPLPAAALHAAADAGRVAAEQGRAKAYFDQAVDVRARLRAAYAGLVGGRPEEIALTTATSDGMARVLRGLGLRRGDEVLTRRRRAPRALRPVGHGPRAARDQRARGAAGRDRRRGDAAHATGS